LRKRNINTIRVKNTIIVGNANSGRNQTFCTQNLLKYFFIIQ